MTTQGHHLLQDRDTVHPISFLPGALSAYACVPLS